MNAQPQPAPSYCLTIREYGHYVTIRHATASSAIVRALQFSDRQSTYEVLAVRPASACTDHGHPQPKPATCEECGQRLPHFDDCPAVMWPDAFRCNDSKHGAHPCTVGNCYGRCGCSHNI